MLHRLGIFFIFFGEFADFVLKINDGLVLHLYEFSESGFVSLQFFD